MCQAELAKEISKARDQQIQQELTNADDYYDIMPVPADAVLTEGDIIFLSCPQHLLTDMKKRKGLKILDSNILHLPDAGTELYELILSPSNPFLDQDLRKSKFAEVYECQIIAYRRREDAFQMGRGGQSRRSLVSCLHIQHTCLHESALSTYAPLLSFIHKQANWAHTSPFLLFLGFVGAGPW